MSEPQKAEKNVTFHGGLNEEREECDDQQRPISFLNVPFTEKNGPSFGNISASSSSASLAYYDHKQAAASFEDQKSPWGSLWLSNVIMLFTGIQFSIYFTSMWPFLQTLDDSANLGFFGFVIASYSVGQAVSSPIFGFWNQKTKGTRRPVMSGMVLTILGNLIYALLPTFSDNRKWIMMFARFLVGFGSGVVGVLRAYISTASTSKDRSKAVALGIAGFVVGIALGPATQTCFQPVGEKGWAIGKLVLNMYTLPSYFVIAGALIVIFLLQFMFVEKYAGIISDEQKKANPYTVLPKFDLPAALVCIFLWFIQQSISTTNEVISAPFTMAMYDWSNNDAVLYNGIIQFVSALVSVSVYLAHAFTPIGKYDSRKLIIFGLVAFFSYHIATLPWPFFSGPLHFQNETANITNGCETSYGCYVVLLGIGYPNVASPLGTLYSQILGPRKQGTMQGVFMFTGSLARCLAPVFVTAMFEAYGPIWPWAVEAFLIAMGVVFVLIAYKRLIPLKTLPRLRSGDKIKYKMGTMYRL
uniref:Major facilitator superfamily (MFS) profile domain-containing protein n=1 Tax=Plectus sambesii TaxID=2011161 RepID=A0A914VZ74_9BILA